MKEIKKKVALLGLAFGIMLAGFPVTAFAYVEEQAETEAEQVLEEVVETEPETFSVSGNGEVLDDISDDGSKEFFTITTANGNNFFLVIDRASSSENVYMLSMIDENDLQEFIEETEGTEESEASIILEETVPDAEPEEEAETAGTAETEEPAQETGADLKVIMPVLFVVALLGAGAFFYFRIYRQKREDNNSESENMEMSDGLETVNEDQDEYPDGSDDDEPEEESGNGYDEQDDARR